MRTFRLPLFAIALLAAPASAKTPDGLTPSVENGCDIYSGSAFGLCNAYCEAMDCDDPRVRASNRACSSVARNFTRATGHTEVPCEAPAPPPPVPTCTVAAEDVGFAITPGSFEFDLVAYFVVVTPADTAVTVSADPVVSQSLAIELDDPATGHFSGEWAPVGEAYLDTTFPYEVCCDETTCDTAWVTVTGSLSGS